MKLMIKQRKKGCADGYYNVKAKGCIAASLHWADGNGALPDWKPFAYIPIGPNGMGTYSFVGGRGIPPEATHVLARAVSEDFSFGEECSEPIQKQEQDTPEEPVQRFLVMTDLHLSSKPWKVRKALAMGSGYDAVLIAGDITNDGSREQLELFWKCVNEVLPEVPVFAVSGNHDYPPKPLPQILYGICDYPSLQQQLLKRAENMGISCQQVVCGAYVAQIGDTEIIGLNAATHWRRLPFQENDQLEWLLFYLLESKAKRHIILCHTPLSEHNPCRSVQKNTYMRRDSFLQRVLDVERTEVIFLSGHTHYSMNGREGSVEMAARSHLYINAGAVHSVTLKPEEALQPECWTEGNVVRLLVGDRRTTVTGVSVKTGQKIARGYYSFAKCGDYAEEYPVRDCSVRDE